MSYSPALFLATSSSAAAASLLPGIDGNALIGAIAGGALFVTSAKELPLWQRGTYLLISTVAGYLAAPEIIEFTPLKNSGVAAFIGGALAVTLAKQAIERIRGFDLSSLLKKPGA